MQKYRIWIGGFFAIMTMGALRLMGKHSNIFILMGSMAIVIALLTFFVIRYMNRKW
jgi:phosphotransferase system  glucose/maltose/N-acetylglucosamine-specific IIC component